MEIVGTYNDVQEMVDKMCPTLGASLKEYSESRKLVKELMVKCIMKDIDCDELNALVDDDLTLPLLKKYAIALKSYVGLVLDEGGEYTYWVHQTEDFAFDVNAP